MLHEAGLRMDPKLQMHTFSITMPTPPLITRQTRPVSTVIAPTTFNVIGDGYSYTWWLNSEYTICPSRSAPTPP